MTSVPAGRWRAGPLVGAVLAILLVGESALAVPLPALAPPPPAALLAQLPPQMPPGMPQIPPGPPPPYPGMPAAPNQQQYCREFNTPVTVGGLDQQAYGTACLQPDGSWQIQQSVDGQPPQTYIVPPQAYQPYYPPQYLQNPWYYGPPLFLGGVFVGGGWGREHRHDGWHGAWRRDGRGGEREFHGRERDRDRR